MKPIIEIIAFITGLIAIFGLMRLSFAVAGWLGIAFDGVRSWVAEKFGYRVYTHRGCTCYEKIAK